MTVLEDLQNYLAYMETVGFGNLQVPADLFARTARRSPAERTASRAAPSQSMPTFAPPPANPLADGTRAVAEKPAPAKAAAAPSLLSIMDMMKGPALESEDNQAKADQVGGETKVDRLRNLYQTFHACQACALGTTRNRFVFGEGDPEASLMFIGEGPGRDEDMAGRPFVGAAGQLLNRIIEAMGFRRDQVFIANVVKCRPPQNRKPLPDETSACTPILVKQIEFVNPKIIVALGATPFCFLKGQNVSIMRHRGQFFKWRDYRVMPTFHPAYILRNPVSKRDVWDDMKKVLAELKKS
ncbi:Type-4 uracil-DNA glycosylase [Sulfidibacter corallicola]|uniref:Type-4 uracil-DNA glycosylase n=1 Tax=Sulfidibacter corallicola TaxID=2818388 RepID=A0A8A4U4X1_SULCO|nr:uracil-DNA glycosylase [Sulfidibacter corallicola]QTD53795.1 uracil-DNA glycosylase [Sulfidibacter corallicola]